LVFVLALGAPALAEEAKGKIKSIDADKSQFVLTNGNGKDWTIHSPCLTSVGNVFYASPYLPTPGGSVFENT